MTTTTYDRRALEVGYKRTILPDGTAPAYPAEVVAVTKGASRTGQPVYTFSYTDDVGTRRTVQVAADPEVFDDHVVSDTSSQWATEQCRTGNCRRRRDLGDGTYCFVHRKVPIGTATLAERWTEHRMNDQRDMPHLDTEDVVYEPQTVDLVVPAHVAQAGEVPANGFEARASFALVGEVVGSANYSSLTMPIASGGGWAMSSTRDETRGKPRTFNRHMTGSTLARILTGETDCLNGKVTLALDGRWAVDGRTVARAT